jgi:uncharacterized protein YidB (DUF937 family)
MYLPVALTTAEEANMGLLDVLNGMQNGPRGAPKPTSANTSSSGGMSPIMMALLGLLAFKAFKGLTGSSKPAAPAPTPAPPPARPAGGTVTAGMPGSAAMPGNLNDLLKGGLGGLLAGGAAGSVLSGGLNDLLKQLQQSGHGETANSWVGTGPNRPISPKDLGSALGADQISALTSEYGLSRDELLDGLSEYLPNVVDHLTPGGKVPSAQEMQRLI